MTTSDNQPIRMTQRSLSLGISLLKVSTVAVVGLLGTQTVVAQTDADAIDSVMPAAAPAIPVEQPLPAAAPDVPVAPSVPAPAAPPPQVIEPVTPSSIVPSSIGTSGTSDTAGTSGSTDAETVDYGTVFLEPDTHTPTLESLLEGTQTTGNEAPAVDVILPADYGTAQIDTTDYSVGATMPDIVISERASGCEFSLQTGQQMANAACQRINQLAATVTGRIAPEQSQLNAAFSGIPGIPQVTGLTTTASREFYNQAAQAVVNLQLGERFIFPLSMPAPLTSLFGWRIHPISGTRRFHSGTDLGAPLGTPVVATQSGRVVLSDALGGYGLIVVLHHSDGTLESRYAHLSRLLVQAGDWVEQGEVIGLVGSTGHSTGPHLHFELRQLTDNGWVVLNPDSLIQQTLGNLTQALGNTLMAFSGNPAATVKGVQVTKLETNPWKGRPFRPAQPHAN